MSIESLYTAHSAQNPAAAKTAGKTGAGVDGAGDGLQGALASGNFFDLFLANITAANKQKSDDVHGADVLDDHDGALDIAALIAEDVQAGDDLAAGDITQALSLNARIFDNILRPMGDEQSKLARSDAHAKQQANAVDALLQRLNGQDEKEQTDLMAVLNALFDTNTNTDSEAVNNTHAALSVNKNTASDADKNVGTPKDVIGLLALNMTPQELKDLQDNLDDAAQDVAALMATLQNDGAVHETTLGAQVNTSAIHAGENIAALDNRYAGGRKLDARFDTPINNEGAHNDADTAARAKRDLRDGAHLKTQNDGAQNNGGADTRKTAAPDFLSIMNDINTGLNTGMMDGALMQASPASPHTPQTLSSNLTHSPHASEAHPATQLVAMQVQKAANDGRNKIFTIQLDPPDLGRVNVRMEFGAKDKTMKTVLTIEKPETFAMLQRDVHALERALQDMGLDIDSGVGFELADGGHDFMGDNRRGGGHDHGGANGAGGDVDGDREEIIETTLSWMVDPETGHTRYDFWA